VGKCEQANTRLVLRAMDEVFTAANLAAVDELYAPHFVNHVPPSLGAEVRGREHVKQFVGVVALPDLVHQVEDVRTDRDMVVVRWRARGTHQGRLWSVGPTGRQLEVPAFEMSRVLDGRIVEQWLALDTLGLAQQVGIAPPLRTP
jgi:predicted SnoaL-like aldol condensation-catalyzing enzyme